MTDGHGGLGMSCSSGDCLDGADVIGHATMRANSRAGLQDVDDVLHTLWLPFCLEHADELRVGATLLDFHSGFPDQDAPVRRLDDHGSRLGCRGRWHRRRPGRQGDV